MAKSLVDCKTIAMELNRISGKHVKDSQDLSGLFEQVAITPKKHSNDPCNFNNSVRLTPEIQGMVDVRKSKEINSPLTSSPGFITPRVINKNIPQQCGGIDIKFLGRVYNKECLSCVPFLLYGLGIAKTPDIAIAMSLTVQREILDAYKITHSYLSQDHLNQCLGSPVDSFMFEVGLVAISKYSRQKTTLREYRLKYDNFDDLATGTYVLYGVLSPSFKAIMVDSQSSDNNSIFTHSTVNGEDDDNWVHVLSIQNGVIICQGSSGLSYRSLHICRNNLPHKIDGYMSEIFQVFEVESVSRNE